MSEIDNIFIQVRSLLNQKSIKLWKEPYYYDEIGSIESELEKLSNDFSRELSISVSKCRCALNELQDGAIRKLAARKEFEESGIATFSVRSIVSGEGTTNIFEVKCRLTDNGSELLALIASRLQLSEATNFKCISAGKMVSPSKSLEAQGLKNNQQLMVIVGRSDGSGNNAKNSEELYARIIKIREDVETVVTSTNQLVDMEDQDGNPVFLPPDENRALLMGLGLCEKAHVAMKREHYDEALLLLLEADEMFSSCNSSFLEAVDNYALLNLDIVWCYLCLKNVSQLPDAKRRLDICERNFHRSYGKNYERLIALKGTAGLERALVMRLHLLQGVILFHENRRDEAYERLELAATELQELKVDDGQLATLVEMGYTATDARLALRACNNNLLQAVEFIDERQQRNEESRELSAKERKVRYQMTNLKNADGTWINPRSVCTLMELGYELDLVVEALKRTKNDVPRALNMLETNADELRAMLPPRESAKKELAEKLQALGFEEQAVRAALETTHNNLDKAIDFLLKMHGSETELTKAIERMKKLMDAKAGDGQASTSRGTLSTSSTQLRKLVLDVMDKAKLEMEAYKAYKRFNEDLTDNDEDYLDLTLLQEEQILLEYKRLLEN